MIDVTTLSTGNLRARCERAANKDDETLELCQRGYSLSWGRAGLSLYREGVATHGPDARKSPPPEDSTDRAERLAREAFLERAERQAGEPPADWDLDTRTLPQFGADCPAPGEPCAGAGHDDPDQVCDECRPDLFDPR